VHSCASHAFSNCCTPPWIGSFPVFLNRLRMTPPPFSTPQVLGRPKPLVPSERVFPFFIWYKEKRPSPFPTSFLTSTQRLPIYLFWFLCWLAKGRGISDALSSTLLNGWPLGSTVAGFSAGDNGDFPQVTCLACTTSRKVLHFRIKRFPGPFFHPKEMPALFPVLGEGLTSPVDGARSSSVKHGRGPSGLFFVTPATLFPLP